jgi:hypothetical protein
MNEKQFSGKVALVTGAAYPLLMTVVAQVPIDHRGGRVRGFVRGMCVGQSSGDALPVNCGVRGKVSAGSVSGSPRRCRNHAIETPRLAARHFVGNAVGRSITVTGRTQVRPLVCSQR